MNTFIQEIGNFGPANTNESAYDTLLGEFKRVLIDSLITSFGLDLFIKDQHGGDVDTIHNVRKIGVDGNMDYKNAANKKVYESRGSYDSKNYHSDSRFRHYKQEARKNYNEHGTKIRDAYTGQELEYTKASAVPKELRLELDHVVECKAIHDDRGRVLSGVSGIDLANQDYNLAWTNKSLNASMGAWAMQEDRKYRKEYGCPAPNEMANMEAYISAHPNLDKETVPNMRAIHTRSSKEYNHTINKAYYTSTSFLKDTVKATGMTAGKMGLKQAVGLVLSEVVFAVMEEFKVAKGTTENLFIRLGNAVQRGFKNAYKRWKDIINKFITGSISGALSSLTTTISNIFFTTAKQTVKIIRQSWASLVEAVKILFMNPDCLPIGEKFRAAAKIIATGASVVVGGVVGEAVKATGIGAIPGVGEIISVFVSSLITGMMSCTLLYALDHTSAITDIINVLNKFPSRNSLVCYFKEQGALLDEYAAKLARIDINKFKTEVSMYNCALNDLENVHNPIEMNLILRDIYFNKLKFESPFGTYDNIDDFMNDPSAKLNFS